MVCLEHHVTDVEHCMENNRRKNATAGVVKYPNREDAQGQREHDLVTDEFRLDGFNSLGAIVMPLVGGIATHMIHIKLVVCAHAP